jgi:serine/threonine protein kinase
MEAFPSKEEAEKVVGKPIETDLSAGYKCYGSFVKKPLKKQDGKDKTRLLDVFREQQMLQAINHINNSDNLVNTELIVEDEGFLVDCYGLRILQWDMCRADEEEMPVAMLLAVCYLADLHTHKRLFHGDIKPLNLFYDRMNCEVGSDSGSLLVTSDKTRSYFVKTHTPGFASAEYQVCCN